MSPILPDPSAPSSWRHRLLPVAVAGLLFLWPVPGTIAARHALALLILALLASLPAARRIGGSLLGHRAAFYPLLLLSAWIAGHDLFLADAPRHALGESLQWFKALLYFAIGYALCRVSPRRDGDGAAPGWMDVLLWSSLAYLAVYFVWRDWNASQPLVAILGANGGFGSRDKASYVCTAVLALLLADLLGRVCFRRRLLHLGTTTAAGLTALALVATLATVTRNALLVAALLCAGAILVLGLQRRTATGRSGMWFGRLAAAGLAAVAIAGAASFSLDERWGHLRTSVATAWEHSAGAQWLAPEHQNTFIGPDGAPIDMSAYLRTAWAIGLAQEIARHPLGVGYDRNAFGRSLREHRPDAVAVGHGHLGLLDFALAVGVPGALLLVAVLGGMAGCGWAAWRRRQAPAGLALCFLAGAFFVRSLVDGVLRDHMLEQVFFQFGLLLAAASLPQADPPPSQSCKAFS